jgi:hypothetical protein
VSTTRTEIAWTDSLVARFWSYVRVGGLDECWLWKGGRFERGYGQFRLGPRKVKAHRCAHELTRGPLEGLKSLHRCDNPPCCNPIHLFSGTPADNAHDRDAKGRTRNGLVSLPGELNPAAKIDRQTAEEIREARRRGLLLREIAEGFGLSQSQVRNIVTGASWR